MKLQEITKPSLKQEVFKVQQELIEQGWDDASVKNDKDGSINLILKYGQNWSINYGVTQRDDDFVWKSWYSSLELSTPEFIQDAGCRLVWFKVHDMVKFSEKPYSLESIRENSKYTVSMAKLKPLIEANELKVYDAARIFSMTSSLHPGSGFRSSKPFGKFERVIMINTNGRYFLIDVTGAVSYARLWAYVDDTDK